MRTSLITLITITLSGCISADYKSGNYWTLDKESSDSTHIIGEQCSNKKIHTNGSTESSSQIIAPYFIPIFYLSGKPDKEIIITIDNQECPELSIIADGNNNLTYTKSAPNIGRCVIYIAQPKYAEIIIIQALNPKNDCDNFSVKLVKKSFFCVRQTEFGGSPGCDKAL